jgi:hypothetical protein
MAPGSIDNRFWHAYIAAGYLPMGQDAVQIGVMHPKAGIVDCYIVIAYVSAYPGAEVA